MYLRARASSGIEIPRLYIVVHSGILYESSSEEKGGEKKREETVERPVVLTWSLEPVLSVNHNTQRDWSLDVNLLVLIP